MDWILARLKEKSTWAGVAGLLGTMGLQVDDGTMQLVSQLVIAGAGLTAIILKEKGI